MNKKNGSLAGLLNLNGSVRLGITYHEPYHFNHLLGKRSHKVSEDILSIGGILVEKLKRIKMIQGDLKNLGMNPLLEKWMGKNQGKTS